MSGGREPWEVRQAEFVAGAVGRAGLPRAGFPQVAFAGRSNVGKSSFINMLVRKHDLARASKAPGRTRQINFFRINDRWLYADLPGYGFAVASHAEMEQWRRMIEEFLEGNDRLRLVVLLLDARREPSPLDDQLVAFLEDRRIPAQVVLTKCDKLSANELAKARRAVARHYGLPAGCEPIATAAAKGVGREEALRMIYKFLQADAAGRG